MNDMGVSIIATEINGSLKADATLEDNVRTACKIAAHHWTVLDDDTQIRGAFGGLLLFYKDKPEDVRIRAELDALKKLSAFIQASQAGLNVNLDSLIGDEDEAAKPEPIGFMKMFREAKANG